MLTIDSAFCIYFLLLPILIQNSPPRGGRASEFAQAVGVGVAAHVAYAVSVPVGPLSGCASDIGVGGGGVACAVCAVAGFVGSLHGLPPALDIVLVDDAAGGGGAGVDCEAIVMPIPN